MKNHDNGNAIQKPIVAPTYRAKVTGKQIKLGVAVGFCYVGLTVLYGFVAEFLFNIGVAKEAWDLSGAIVLVLPALAASMLVIFKNNAWGAEMFIIFAAVIFVLSLSSTSDAFRGTSILLGIVGFCIAIIYGLVSLVCGRCSKAVVVNGANAQLTINADWLAMRLIKINLFASMIWILAIPSFIWIISKAMSGIVFWLPFACLYWRYYHGRQLDKYVVVESGNAAVVKDGVGLYDVEWVKAATNRRRRVGRVMLILQVVIVAGFGVWLGSQVGPIWLAMPPFVFNLIILFAWSQLIVGFPLLAVWYGVMGVERKWIRALALAVTCTFLPLVLGWFFYTVV